MRKIIALVIFFFLIPHAALADLTVYFLDVGQGDCAIIECDGDAMIIDGGLPGQSSKVYSFIKNLKFRQFLYMVATHPDNDHIGGLSAVLKFAKEIKKPVKYLYSPIKEYDSPRFADLKEKAKENKLKITIPEYNSIHQYYLGSAEVIFYNGNYQKKKIVHSAVDWFKTIFKRDVPEEIKENNDMSLVVKIIYKETSFLFTGDIETEAEERLKASGIDLSADVLKVAHHGSNNSTSYDFLSEVNPQYAIISCGQGNSYGHPNQETLDKLKDIELYRTDLQGNIICRSDGYTITFETEKKASSDLFVAPEKN